MQGLSAAEKFDIITRDIPRGQWEHVHLFCFFFFFFFFLFSTAKTKKGEAEADFVIGADEIKAILESGRDINLYWGTGASHVQTFPLFSSFFFLWAFFCWLFVLLCFLWLNLLVLRSWCDHRPNSLLCVFCLFVCLFHCFFFSFSFLFLCECGSDDGSTSRGLFCAHLQDRRLFEGRMSRHHFVCRSARLFGQHEEHMGAAPSQMCLVRGEARKETFFLCLSTSFFHATTTFFPL